MKRLRIGISFLFGLTLALLAAPSDPPTVTENWIQLANGVPANLRRADRNIGGFIDVPAGMGELLVEVDDPKFMYLDGRSATGTYQILGRVGSYPRGTYPTWWLVPDPGVFSASPATSLRIRSPAPGRYFFGAFSYTKDRLVTSYVLKASFRPKAPEILRSPSSVDARVGDRVTFSVIATGTELAYQWYKDSNAIPNARASTFMLRSAALSDAGQYHAIVTNSGGKATSASARLTVSKPIVPDQPTIVEQPADQTIRSGQVATLKVRATGTEPLTYQWYRGESGTTSDPIREGTGTSFTTPALTQTAKYWVRVNNASRKPADSRTATVMVASPEPTWTEMRIPDLPVGTPLGRVWARNRDDVYVWAYRTTSDRAAWLYRWDGSTWTRVLSLSGYGPGPVYGVGDSEVYAASELGGRGELHRSLDRGRTWQKQTLPAELGNVTLGEISGTPNNIHVCSGANIFRFDGKAWRTIFTDRTYQVYRQTVLSEREGYYVNCWGWGRWDGNQWRFNGTQFDFCDIYGLWGTRDAQGRLQMYAVGNNNFSNGVRVWKFDESRGTFGSKQGYVFSDGSGYNVGTATGVWGSGANDVYVIGGLASSSGGKRTGRVYRFDGTRWQSLFGDRTLGYPGGVHGSASDDVWLTFDDGTILRRGSSPPPVIAPTIVEQPVDQAILSGQVATLKVRATGTEPLTYQWYRGESGVTSDPIREGTLASYTTPALSTTARYWVRVSNASRTPADSRTATVTVVSPEPTWTEMRIPDLPVGTPLGRVWARNRDDVYVWAYRTTSDRAAWLYRWDGSTWTRILSLPGSGPGPVYGVGDSEVYAASELGGRGELHRSLDRGRTWQKQTLPAELGNVTLGEISGTPNNIHVCSGANIFRFDGKTWRTVFADRVYQVYRQTLLSEREGYYVNCWGWGRWDGSQWRFNGTQFDFCDIYGLWGTRDAQGRLQMYAVGNNNFSNGVRVWKFDESRGTFGSKQGYVFSDGSGYNLGTATGVWGSGANDVYVIGGLASSSGGKRTGRVYRFDGTRWQSLFGDRTLGYPGGVHGSASDDVWLTFDDGRILRYAPRAVGAVRLSSLASEAPEPTPAPVFELPSLRPIQVKDCCLELAWEDDGQEVVVETAERLEGPWHESDYPVNRSNGLRVLSVPRTDPARFFRLRR